VVAEAGADRRRLHQRPWSSDEYVKCVTLHAPAAFAGWGDTASDSDSRRDADAPMPTAKLIPPAVELLDSTRPMAMEEWREVPGEGGCVSSSGDKPARYLLPYFKVYPKP